MAILANNTITVETSCTKIKIALKSITMSTKAITMNRTAFRITFNNSQNLCTNACVPSPIAMSCLKLPTIKPIITLTSAPEVCA